MRMRLIVPMGMRVSKRSMRVLVGVLLAGCRQFTVSMVLCSVLMGVPSRVFMSMRHVAVGVLRHAASSLIRR